MRVLLINISKNWRGRVYSEYPLGLGIIGTILKSNNHIVKIHDMAINHENIDNVILSFSPDVVGLSFLSTSANTAFQVINKIRSIKSFHLIAGGVHTSLFYKDVLKAGVDIAVIGEAENIIIPLFNLLNKIEHKDFHNRCDFLNIENIAIKENENSIFLNKATKLIKDIDDFPIIDRDLFEIEKYHYHSIVSSRGCLYNCRFCSSQKLLGKIPRSFSIKRILTEIQYLKDKFDNIKLYWADDMFFYSHKERINFCNELLKNNLSIDYVIQLRADNVNIELIDALKATGCSKIAIGAESGSEKILHTIKKGITVEQIETAINLSVSNSMRIKTWWIIGLPGDYCEQLKSLELIKKTLPNEVAIHTFVPLPGSDFWNKHKSFGIKLPKNVMQLESSYYSFPEHFSLSYLSNNQLKELILTYEFFLQSLNYIPTDIANTEDNYIYTSPNQKSTFKV